MVLRSQGEIIGQTDTVQLRIPFYDLNGNLADPISFPSVSIIQPSGNVYLAPTSAGVYRQAQGIFGYDLTLSLAAELGGWTASWRGIIPSGQVITKESTFLVFNSQLPLINSDGYVALGDDPGFHYNQVEIRNINKILKAVKARLRSSGKAAGKDSFGNPIYADCDIFTVDTLVTFIAQALSEFNAIPHFTLFTFCDTPIINQFFDVFVQGAVIYALSSQALIERGSEFVLSDAGVAYTPPTVSELLNTQYSTELTNYFEKIKMIKASMKPSPLGLGSSWGTVNGDNPAWRRLRHLRERKIY